MAKVLTNNQYYYDIATAIRTKENSDTLYKPAQMAARITELFNQTNSGDYSVVEVATPVLDINNDGLITATSTQSAGVVFEDTKTAVLQLTTRQGATITPSTSAQTIASAGDYVTGNITVSAMPQTTVATPTITVSSSGKITATQSQSEGYTPGGTKTATQQLSTFAGNTYTPGTSNITLNTTSKYGTGNIVIQGSSNLIPENILDGVSIFNVTGNVKLSYYYTGYGMPSATLGSVGDFYYDLGEA